jgi:hypothetical protein
MNQETRPPQVATIIRFPGRSATRPVQGTADAHWRELILAVREGLATAQDDPLDERDRRAIADEYTFKARFGFVRPRRDRERLIRMKHTFDLTDDEIRVLKRAGALSFGVHQVRWVAERWLAAYGWLVLGFLGLQESIAWVMTLQRSVVPPLLLLKLVSLTAVFSGLGWLVHTVHVQPWQIAKRVRRRQLVD